VSPRLAPPRPPADDERRSARARRTHTLDDDERFHANRAAFAAIKTLRVIRGYLIGYAVIAGLVLVAMWKGGAGPLPLSVATVLMTVSAAGALLVIQQPLVWTVVNAILATPILLWAVLGFLAGRLGVFTLMAGITGVGFWVAVPVAAKLQRLMREHPDLWVFRRTRGELTQQHAEKWRAEARRTRRRVLAGLGLCILAIVGLAFWAIQRGKPPVFEEEPLPVPTRPFEAAEMDWRAAWNASRVDEVKAFIATTERAKLDPFLDRQRKKRGWDTLPNLGPPDVTDKGHNHRFARYMIDDRERPIEVRWVWEPDRWVVLLFTFPNQ
jgi:hypothetical protein